LLDELLRELDRLESLWSRFLPDSELTRLNNAEGSPIEVDPATVGLIREMRAGFVETAGAFDPTLLPSLIDAGYAESPTIRNA